MITTNFRAPWGLTEVSAVMLYTCAAPQPEIVSTDVEPERGTNVAKVLISTHAYISL